MCTVTAQRRAAGWLVTMNRDEARMRAEGLPPTLWQTPPILAPRDPQAGGTWIGVRADGIWGCLLNGYIPDTNVVPVAEPQTRGRIIPEILSAPSPTDAVPLLPLERTFGFRLWIGDETGITEYFWDQRQLSKLDLQSADWSFVTSSFYEQTKVTQNRHHIFETWQDNGAPLATNGLPSLHVERNGLAATEAIPMERPLARTRSITQIEINPFRIEMRYWPEDTFQDRPATFTSMKVTQGS